MKMTAGYEKKIFYDIFYINYVDILIEIVTNGTTFNVYEIVMNLVNYLSQFLPSILIV